MKTLAEERGADAVREMFGRIAPRYDFLNHALSLNLDRGWRAEAVRRALAGRPRRILDLATGTGDLALALRARSSEPLVVGADFALPMLDLAARKGRAAGHGGLVFAAADALRLPFADGSFDRVTIAFGLRNFADLGQGLREMRRVLAPGGRLLALEFSIDVAPPLRWAYLPYFRWVLPRLGALVSGSAAYAYLYESVAAFPPPAEIRRRMTEAGFSESAAHPLTCGSVLLYEGLAARARSV